MVGRRHLRFLTLFLQRCFAQGCFREHGQKSSYCCTLELLSTSILREWCFALGHGREHGRHTALRCMLVLRKTIIVLAAAVCQRTPGIARHAHIISCTRLSQPTRPCCSGCPIIHPTAHPPWFHTPDRPCTTDGHPPCVCQVLRSRHQVSPDFRDIAAVANDLGDIQMADRAKDNWLKTAVSFLHTKVGDKRAHTDENTTIYRKKSLRVAFGNE